MDIYVHYMGVYKLLYIYVHDMHLASSYMIVFVDKIVSVIMPIDVLYVVNRLQDDYCTSVRGFSARHFGL